MDQYDKKVLKMFLITVMVLCLFGLGVAGYGLWSIHQFNHSSEMVRLRRVLVLIEQEQYLTNDVLRKQWHIDVEKLRKEDERTDTDR